MPLLPWILKYDGESTNVYVVPLNNVWPSPHEVVLFDVYNDTEPVPWYVTLMDEIFA